MDRLMVENGQYFFVVTCPAGHDPDQNPVQIQRFGVTQLATLVAEGKVEFWCNLCGQGWPAAQTEVEQLRRAMA